MEIERLEDGLHKGYTMPHRDYMEEMGLKEDDLNEFLKSHIRVFEDKYDQSLNDDGYLDEKEETELLTESTKIKQEMEAWYKNKNKDDSGKNAAGITLTVLGILGLIFGISQLKE